MKRITPLIWAIAVILALGFGIYAGHKVTTAYKDMEIMDLQAQVETANASLADANVELAFWKNAMRGLAEGGQFEGVDFEDEPNVELTRIPADATNGFDDIFYPPKLGRKKGD